MYFCFQNPSLVENTQSSSPQASSSSNWGLKVVYEQQINTNKNMKLSVDPGYPVPRRPRG